MIPIKKIETELKLLDAEISLNTTLPVPEPLNVTYTSERHLFANRARIRAGILRLS